MRSLGREFTKILFQRRTYVGLGGPAGGAPADRAGARPVVVEAGSRRGAAVLLGHRQQRHLRAARGDRRAVVLPAAAGRLDGRRLPAGRRSRDGHDEDLDEPAGRTRRRALLEVGRGHPLHRRRHAPRGHRRARGGLARVRRPSAHHAVRHHHQHRRRARAYRARQSAHPGCPALHDLARAASSRPSPTRA